MILIISFISSFERNKVNRSLVLNASFLLVFLSNLFLKFEGKFLTNPGKLSLAEGISRSVITFLP